MKYLLDTNICIYIIKNKYTNISDKMSQVRIENVFLSSITIAEMEFCIAKNLKLIESKQRLYEFMIPFTILDFDLTSAQHYGNIKANLKKNGRPVGELDMQIASIALANDMTLVTNNEKEFIRIPDLTVQNWIN